MPTYRQKTMSTIHHVTITEETREMLDQFKGEEQDYDEAIAELYDEYKKADLFARTNKILAETDDDEWVPL